VCVCVCECAFVCVCVCVCVCMRAWGFVRGSVVARHVVFHCAGVSVYLCVPVCRVCRSIVCLSRSSCLPVVRSCTPYRPAPLTRAHTQTHTNTHTTFSISHGNMPPTAHPSPHATFSCALDQRSSFEHTQTHTNTHTPRSQFRTGPHTTFSCALVSTQQL